MVGGSSPEVDRLASRLLKEESQDGVFCRPGCLDGRDARVCRDPKRYCCARGKGAVYTCQYCGRTGSSSELSVDPIRNRPDGTDALSRLEPPRVTRGLRREPAGLSGAEIPSDPQNRSHDARDLAHLARTGFFKPVHVKSLPAHAVRSL